MIISRRTADLATAAVTAAVGAIVCYGALENGISWAEGGPQPGYFPFYVGLLIIFGSAATILQTLRRGDGETFLDSEKLGAVTRFFLPVAGLTLITAFLGLYIGITAYLFWTLWRGAGVRPLRALAVAVFVAALNYVIFEIMFGVPLLKGPVLNALGIW